MKGKKADKLDRLLELARGFQPDTSRAELGFDTRLMAGIARLRSGELGDMGDAGAFLAVFTSWMWRSAVGLVPVAAVAVAACFFWFGLSLPADANSFVNHVTAYLPYNPF